MLVRSFSFLQINVFISLLIIQDLVKLMINRVRRFVRRTFCSSFILLQDRLNCSISDGLSSCDLQVCFHFQIAGTRFPGIFNGILVNLG